MEEESEAVFNLKLQVEQLQEKVAFLAGGTNEAQLVEVLMEKEEEGRMKDKTISALETQIHDLMTQLSSADRERSTLRVLSTEQARSIDELRDQVANLTAQRDGLRSDVKTATGQIEALETERVGLEQLLEATKAKLESTSSQLAQRQAELAHAQETLRTHERTIDDLQQRKKDMASRTRTMKAELEQKLADEKTNYSVLDGQLAACKAEMRDLKQHLHQKSRTLEEYQAKETAFAQEKGRLEVKVAALGEENRKLQQVILQLERQRKEVESQNVSTNNRAAKYEEDIICLQRELERQKAAQENDLAKISQQARARDAAWRDKIQRERGDLHRVIREKEEVAGMLAEESEGRQLLLMEHIQDSERRSDELADEVDRLIKRVLELEQEKKEMEEYKRNELESERHFRTEIQSEMSELRRELLQQRKAGAEFARIRQENEALKEKIARQEAFMLRRMKQTKGGKDASLPATAFLDVRPLEEDVNRANHDHHPSSTTQTPTAMQSPMPSSSAASPSSYGNVPGKLFAREDKENYLYKSIPPASTRQGSLGDGTPRANIRAQTPPLRREGLAPAGRASTPVSARGAAAQPKPAASFSSQKGSVRPTKGVSVSSTSSMSSSSTFASRPSPGRAPSPAGGRSWR